MEHQLAELIGGILRRGHLVTVISRRCDLPAHPGLEWIRVPGPARPFPLAYPWFFIAGTWQVWRHKLGLLHTTGAIVWNRADLCTMHYCHHAARGKVRMMAGAHSITRRINSHFSAAFALIAERLIYRPSKIGQLVAVSSGVAVEAREYFPKLAQNITVIPNAVDRNTFRPDTAARAQVRRAYGMSGSAFVALFVGGDWDRKGLSLAIRAVSTTRDCHLLVVGSGDIDRFRIIAEKLRAADRIHFTGSRKDAPRFYAAADVFLLPSAYETFSLVAYEAAAAGLALLATRVSGVEQILADGENGWFIEPDPDIISSRLEALRANEALRKRMGARSREAIGQYSWPRMVRDYLSLYGRLAPTPSGPNGIADLTQVMSER